MKKWTLQARLTAIVGGILLAACLLLTANSLFAANTYYGDYAALIESGLAEIDPAWEEGAGLDPSLASPEEFYLEASQKFSAQSLLAMALIVALALGCTYWAAGRVLRPLKKLTKSVEEIDDLNLDSRIATEKARGEVLALTESFNGMLGRLEESFLIQKSFAANAAHELKTPLAVIKSSLQVLEMDPNPSQEDCREFMSDTGESLERIIKTVEGLLALANIGTVSVDDRVEPRPMLLQAVQELSQRAKAGGVTLSVEGEAPSVMGNPGLLYRAFYNLIENAIKYNRPGGSVKIALKEEEGAVLLSVADTGTGIPEEALPHIFEPFYRADPSRSQRIPGSGLGLAVVKMILDRHNVSIRAASSVESGSVFALTFKPVGEKGELWE